MVAFVSQIRNRLRAAGYTGSLWPLGAWSRDPSAPVSVTYAMAVFALSGLATLVLVGSGGVLLARRTANDEAVRDALVLTEVVGRAVIEPVVEDGLLNGDPTSIERLDAVVRSRVIGQQVVRVKVWSLEGVVLYSDEPRVIGRQFPLGEDETDAFAQNGAVADISDLTRPENEYERVYEELLEVYFPVHTATGTRLLFEVYLPYASVRSTTNQVWGRFAPTLILGLLTLAILQLPLVWTLANNLRRGHAERERLLERLVDASEQERRVIAAELHDHAVQDLVGQSYGLQAIADQLNGAAPPEVVGQIRDAAARTRATVTGLRTLLVDLYPPNLRSEGLETALSDLAAPLRAAGIDVTLSVDPDMAISGETERLLYRAAREALRNVQQHAHADRVNVVAACEDGFARLAVVDNGVGMPPEARLAQRAAGHLGLDLIEDLVRDRGGEMTIEPRPQSGTRLEVAVPIQ